ncbi:MAG: putative sortase (Surface protein transpeptidase) [Frankiales bacterium]|nr:putative sortase (Surface protein transpeptidase) [Frankiales bacterium]
MGDRIRWLLRGIGQLLITAGVVVLLFCVYELEVTNLYTKKEQKALDKTLTQQWEQPNKPVPVTRTQLAAYDGKGIARIYFPTLGKKEVHVVVEGVSHEDLKKGPGHYPGTSLPGAVGNVVISGHRTTYGAPFNRLDELKVGAPVVLETRSMFFTYTVRGLTIVQPDAVGETDPVPNQPTAKPTEKLLTLTTCNPKYSARTRLVIRAVMSSSLVKGPGVVPPALEGR